MARDAKEKELWVEFAVAAMQSYRPDPESNEDETVDDMVTVASGFADAMLDAMDERYTEKSRRGGKRRGREEEEEE